MEILSALYSDDTATITLEISSEVSYLQLLYIIVCAIVVWFPSQNVLIELLYFAELVK